MTASDFVRGFLGLYPDANYDPASVALLGGILDTSKDGYYRNIAFINTSDYIQFLSGLYHFLSSRLLKDSFACLMQYIKPCFSFLTQMAQGWCPLVS